MKKVLHLLSGGGAGGIELLCEQIGLKGKEDHEFCVLFDWGEIGDRMKKEGLKTYDYSELSRSLKLNGLKQLVSKNRYDAIVVHHEGVGIYHLYLKLMKKFKGPQYIKYLHCSYEEKFFSTGNKIKDMLHYKLLGDCLKRSDAVIAVSEYTKRSYVEEFGIPSDKIKVVYNGIEMPRENEVVTSDKEKETGLLYIGRLVDVKGVDVLIGALGILAGESRTGNIHLDILGDGPARASLEQKSREKGLTDTVTFHGVVLEKDSFFRKAQIFVYPPVWQEAFGISIIEAMSWGLLCVASRVGGIPEIITDESQGILFEAGNAKALAHALEKAIDIAGSEKASEFISASKQRAASFSIEKSIEGLERLLK